MRRIFLDVGANTGQTLAAVIDPEFHFDRIICFEPVQSCWKKLLRIADAQHNSECERITHPNSLHPCACKKTVEIVPFGLWNQNCERPIYGPGNAGASLWKKNDHRKWKPTAICKFRRATDWFQENIEAGDIVFLKLNCEGAECDILDDLLDSGEFAKVSFAMIDFDVRKIASQKHREAEIRARLESEGLRFPRVAFSKDVMIGATHAARIRNWLNLVLSAEHE
jgi:FkbM family methyltransferase